MKNKTFKIIYTLLFCFSAILFFNPAFGPPALYFYLYYTLFIVTFFIVIAGYKKSYNSSITLGVLLLLIAEFVSAVNATVSWDQTIFESMTAMLPYMCYILFFLLIVWELPAEVMEKIILITGGAFILVYLISFKIYPRILFGTANEFDPNRGFERIRTSGIGFLFLLTFLSLSKFMLNRKFMWLILYFICMICIVMSLTRTYMLFMVPFSLIYALKNSSITTKIMTVLVAVTCFYFVSQMEFYKLLSEETDSQKSYVKEDIRYQSADFYLNNFSPNTFSVIFGNGQKNSNKNTKYARYIDYLEKEVGFFTADLGYIGLYVKFGVLAILAYLILIYKTITTSVNLENLYCKYFLLFIFSISVIIDCPFDISIIPSIALALYILSLPKTEITILQVTREKSRISNQFI